MTSSNMGCMPNLTESEERNSIEINNYYIKIKGIYVNYRTKIRPFIAMLELFDCEFPVEILNEIRAIFQHLARCYYCPDFDSSSLNNIEKEIQKANGHINRALLDCFKYSCLTLYDEYIRFTNLYRYVDLSTLDNGDFLKNMHLLSKKAKKADKLARQKEGEVGDDKEVFLLYEDAFNKSAELYKYIEKHAEYAAKLKRKLRISQFLAVLGWIIGIVSGLCTIWQMWGDQIKPYIWKICEFF